MQLYVTGLRWSKSTDIKAKKCMEVVLHISAVLHINDLLSVYTFGNETKKNNIF